MEEFEVTDYISEERLKEFKEYQKKFKNNSTPLMADFEFFEKEINQFRDHFEHVKNNLTGFEQAREIIKMYEMRCGYMEFETFAGFIAHVFDGERVIWNRLKNEEAYQPNLLFMLLTQVTAEHLARISNIGPIRQIPSRYYAYNGSLSEIDSKGSNMADILYSNRNLLKIINQDLDAFNQNYHIDIVEYSNNQPASNENLFSLQLINKKNGLWSNFTDVGFGFSQLLPIIVNLRTSKDKLILIEQPEVE